MISQQYLITFKICTVSLLLLGAGLSANWFYECQRADDATHPDTHPFILFIYIFGIMLYASPFIISAIWLGAYPLTEWEKRDDRNRKRQRIQERIVQTDLEIAECQWQIEHLKGQLNSLSD